MDAALRRLRAALDSHAPPRARLYQGADAFWAAMFHEPDWPTPLREHGERVVGRLFAHGVMRVTIDRLSDAQVEEILRDLDLFHDAATQIDWQRTWKNPGTDGADGSAGSDGSPPSDDSG